MNLVDLVVLRRAEEQSAAVVRLAGPEAGKCACGAPLAPAAATGRRQVTCGAKACRQARIYQQRVERAMRRG